MGPRDESGQTLVEFMLTLMVAVSMVVIISLGFKRSLRTFWIKLAREISAPCPKCEPPPNVR